MEIKYKNTLDKQLLEASKIQWKFGKKKSTKAIVLCIIASVVFFLWGFFTTKSSSFWNFKTSLGLAYAILVIIVLIEICHNKSKYLRNCKKAIENKNERLIEYIFTDEKIIIKEVNAYAESGWDIITGYRIYSNFIFLYIHSSHTSFFTIDQNDMNDVDFATLSTFIFNKIPLMK